MRKVFQCGEKETIGLAMKTVAWSACATVTELKSLSVASSERCHQNKVLMTLWVHFIINFTNNPIWGNNYGCAVGFEAMNLALFGQVFDTSSVEVFAVIMRR